MKKKKLDPKVIRVGDKVSIINPEFFIRCGYPLTIADVKANVSPEERQMINRLLFYEQDLKSSNYIEDLLNYPHPIYERCFGEILSALAFFKCKCNGFGGNKREIYTERREAYKDKIFRVIGKRICKTGVRYSGWEDEPPTLLNEKTHIILDLVCDDEYIWSCPDCRIEATNVKKLPQTVCEYSAY